MFGNDKERIEGFLEQLTLDGLSPARLNKYIFTLTTLKRLLGRDFNTLDEEDIKKTSNPDRKNE
jgi:hypothetical protein